MRNLNSSDFVTLVEAASLAPTADNKREFKMENLGQRIRIWCDDSFVCAPRHRRILRLIALGAAAENMRLRAGRLGMDTKIQWFPDGRKPELVAEITLHTLSPADVDPIEGAIAQRHSNRRMIFRGPAFSREQLRSLSAEVDGIDGVELHWFDSPPERKQILRLVRLAETDRFRSRQLHEELFSAVRFDRGWKATSDDGLPPGALEVEAWMRPMFAALRHWNLVRRLHAVGVHHALGMRAAYLPCRFAPHVGALTTSADLDSGTLAAGAAFQRIWLRATLLGVELQPFAAPAVFALPGCGWASPHVRSALQEGWENLTPRHSPIMVFRIGHAPAPSVRTSRPVLDEYCVDPPGRAS